MRSQTIKTTNLTLLSCRLLRFIIPHDNKQHCTWKSIITLQSTKVQTLATDMPEVSPLFALLPRSTCTEMVAWVRSTPALSSACVRVFNNLIDSRKLILLIVYIHTSSKTYFGTKICEDMIYPINKYKIQTNMAVISKVWI